MLIPLILVKVLAHKYINCQIIIKINLSTIFFHVYLAVAPDLNLGSLVGVVCALSLHATARCLSQL